MTEYELTAKQTKFIDEYLVDLNATQAAIRAGYSRRTARTIAADLLANVYIKAALKVAQDDLARRTGITQEMVIAELKEIAFSRIGDFIEWGPDGIVLKSSGLDADQSAPVADISMKGAAGGVRVRLYDKLRALELLGKHLGLFSHSDEVRISPIFVFGDMMNEVDSVE